MNKCSFSPLLIFSFLVGLGLLLHGIISAKQSINAFAIAWLEFVSGFMFLSSEHRLEKLFSAFTWLATVFGMTLFLWIVARPVAITWLAFLAIVFGVTTLLSRIYSSSGSIKMVIAACLFIWIVAPNFALFVTTDFEQTLPQNIEVSLTSNSKP
jgi:hypothetical protein